MSKRILVTHKGSLYPVDSNEILWLQANGSYTFIHCENGSKYQLCKNLKTTFALLDQTRFVQIHQSYVVALPAIKKYEPGRGGLVVLENDHSLPVSQRMKHDFLDRFAK